MRRKWVLSDSNFQINAVFTMTKTYVLVWDLWDNWSLLLNKMYYCIWESQCELHQLFTAVSRWLPRSYCWFKLVLARGESASCSLMCISSFLVLWAKSHIWLTRKQALCVGQLVKVLDFSILAPDRSRFFGILYSSLFFSPTVCLQKDLMGTSIPLHCPTPPSSLLLFR